VRIHAQVSVNDFVLMLAATIGLSAWSEEGRAPRRPVRPPRLPCLPTTWTAAPGSTAPAKRPEVFPGSQFRGRRRISPAPFCFCPADPQEALDSSAAGVVPIFVFL